MATASFPSGSSDAPERPGGDDVATPKRHPISRRNRALFFLTAWLIVLMPFLFWWGTWFGRELPPEKINEYLKDDKHPRHIQHALVQIGERMSRQDPAAAGWRPELIRLASHPTEEVRNTDAWVMGQDVSSPGFHEALLAMLQDRSLTVRGNAALSLVRFGDPAGRPQILALLQSAQVTTATSGRVVDIDKAGTSIRQGGLLAKVRRGETTVEVRSPISGRIQSVSVNTGAEVSAGARIAVVDPAADQVWEALRALYLVGQTQDLPAVQAWERELPEISDRVRLQARLAERAIRDRASH